VEVHRVEILRLPHFLDNWLTDGGEVVSFMHPPPFSPRIVLVLTSVRGWVDLKATVRLEGLDQLNNPMTSLGIKTMTCWLVVNNLFNKNVNVRLFKILNLRRFFTDCSKFWHNVAFEYARVSMYLYYIDVTPVTGKNMLPLKHSAICWT
jgi:hypothetical protein